MPWSEVIALAEEIEAQLDEVSQKLGRLQDIALEQYRKQCDAVSQLNGDEPQVQPVIRLPKTDDKVNRCVAFLASSTLL